MSSDAGMMNEMMIDVMRDERDEGSERAVGKENFTGKAMLECHRLAQITAEHEAFECH